MMRSARSGPSLSMPRANSGPSGLADQDVRGRAHRQADPRRAALDHVVGDLHAGAARPHDQHVLAAEGLGVAVLGRVQEAAAVARAARPVGDVRGVRVAARDDHLPGRDVAGRGVQRPARAVAVDALEPRVEPNVEPLAARVVLEVADHLVARRERPVLAGVALAGKVREPAARVQAQPVVAAAPRRADGGSLLEHGRPDAQPAQLGGRGQPGRTRPNDDNSSVNHATECAPPKRLLLWDPARRAPGWVQFTPRVPSRPAPRRGRCGT